MPDDPFLSAADAAAELARLAADNPLAVGITIRIEALRRDDDDQLAIGIDALATPGLIADIRAAVAKHMPGTP